VILECGGQVNLWEGRISSVWGHYLETGCISWREAMHILKGCVPLLGGI
jgi:hypothetical protein